MTDAAEVRFERVSKRFGGNAILHEIDLTVEPGECLVLLGPSGCGKTTLLRLLAGLETSDGGRISIGGRLVNDVPAADRDVAMVFQNYALYPHLSVYDNIAFPLVTRRVAAEETQRRVRDVAQRLNLTACLDRRPAQLSGGQQQRVALARAIVRSPTVYLMDEPLSNLDAQLRVQTRAELKRLQQELKTTTIYVTHDQAEAMTLGRRVAIMRAGRIEQIGPPLELYRKPANTFVAQFLGSPAINLWSAALAAALGHGPRTLAAARPEDVQVTRSPGPGWTEAIVEVIEPVGNETIVSATAAGERVIARCAADVTPDAGQAVWIRIDPSRVLLFDRDTGVRMSG